MFPSSSPPVDQLAVIQSSGDWLTDRHTAHVIMPFARNGDGGDTQERLNVREVKGNAPRLIGRDNCASGERVQPAMQQFGWWAAQ